MNPYAEVAGKTIWQMALATLQEGFFSKKYWLLHCKLASGLHFELVDYLGMAPCQRMLGRPPDLSQYVDAPGTLVLFWNPIPRRTDGKFRNVHEVGVLLGPAYHVLGSTQGQAVLTAGGRVTAVTQVLPVRGEMPFRDQAILLAKERHFRQLLQPAETSSLVYKGYHLPDLIILEDPLTVRKKWNRYYTGLVEAFDPIRLLFYVYYPEDQDEEEYTPDELFRLLHPPIEEQVAKRKIKVPAYASRATEVLPGATLKALPAQATMRTTADPSSPPWHKAIKGADSDKWSTAALKEFSKLLNPEDPVLRFEPFPAPDSGIVYAVFRCVVVCKVKAHGDLHNEGDKVYKVRFCVQGNQVQVVQEGLVVFKGCPSTPAEAAPGMGPDVDIGDAKVVRPHTLPVLAIVGMNAGYDPPAAADVTSAFTQQAVPPHVHIYLVMPEGSTIFADPQGNARPCHMLKWLYGHPLANTMWFSRMRMHAKAFPMQLIDYTGCVGVHGKVGDKDFCAQATIVDDFFTVSDKVTRQRLMDHWLKIVQIGCEPVLSRYAGMNFTFSDKYFTIDQRDTIVDMCAQHGIDSSYKGRLYRSPVSTGFTICPEDSPATPVPSQVKRAQGWVGELGWLASRCRPDILYPLSLMARTQLNPGDAHFEALHRITVYLWTTRDLKLTYHKGKWFGPDGMEYGEYEPAYFPDSAIGIAEGYHSQTGLAVMMGGAALIGACKSS